MKTPLLVFTVILLFAGISTCGADEFLTPTEVKAHARTHLFKVLGYLNRTDPTLKDSIKKRDDLSAKVLRLVDAKEVPNTLAKATASLESASRVVRDRQITLLEKLAPPDKYDVLREGVRAIAFGIALSDDADDAVKAKAHAAYFLGLLQFSDLDYRRALKKVHDSTKESVRLEQLLKDVDDPQEIAALKQKIEKAQSKLGVDTNAATKLRHELIDQMVTPQLPPVPPRKKNRASQEFVRLGTSTSPSVAAPAACSEPPRWRQGRWLLPTAHWWRASNSVGW